jgi:uncharacterized repeat protein (TIGR01451 family)
VTGVQFNGALGTSFNLEGDTAIQVNAPSGVSTGPLTLISSFGNVTTASNFYVPPQISAVSPPFGRPGTNVTIVGSSFIGTTAVNFGMLAATSFNVLSNGAIIAVVPTNAVSGPITVMAPGGSYVTTSNFLVAPNIFSFSPYFGPGGTKVTITGANLDLGSLVVKFNGITAPITSHNFNTAVVTSPTSTTGYISVSTSDGAFTNTSSYYYYPPSLTDFHPRFGPSNTLVTVSGNSLLGVTNVSFNGVPALTFYPTNNVFITAVVPAGVSTGPVSVSNPAGSSSSLSVLFYSPPIIFGFNPTHGLPGTNVVITGANFQGTTSVLFNGLTSSFTVPGAGQINATVPPNAQTGPITVIGSGGTNVSANNFVLDYGADVSVSVTALPNPVVVSSNLAYTIKIQNNGPLSATNTMLTNSLPPSSALVSASTTQGTLVTNASPITGNLGILTPGASATVTLTVVPWATGTVADTASVGSAAIDVNPADNTYTLLVTVLPSPILTIALSNSDLLVITWPSALTNFGLQYSTNLGPGATWSADTNVPQNGSGVDTVTETNPGVTTFYRLRELP